MWPWTTRNTYHERRATANDSARLARSFCTPAVKGFAAQRDRHAHVGHLVAVRAAGEAPIVRDADLKSALIDWLEAHAAAWHRQADANALTQDLFSARITRGKAAVCQQLANDLREAGAEP